MKKWVALSKAGLVLVRSDAETHAEAVAEIEQQLNRPGREFVYEHWVRDGRIVDSMELPTFAPEQRSPYCPSR